MFWKRPAFLRLILLLMCVVSYSYAHAAGGNENAIDKAGITPAPVTSFFVDQYVVKGNTVLPGTSLEQAVYPYLGPDKRAADIDAARRNLEEAYHQQGYRAVAVVAETKQPAQGIVYLQVIENPIGRLHVQGARYFLPSAIKDKATSLRPGTVLDFNAVRQDIVSLNQWPDRTVTPIIKAGHEPGTIDADLNVEDRYPLHANLEINDRQSQGTTPLRLNANVSYSNLWQLGHNLSLSYQLAPERPSDAKVFYGSYLARIPDSPVSLQLLGINSDSNVATLGGTNVLGKGSIVTLQALIALNDVENLAQTIFAGISYKHFLDQTILVNQSSLSPVTYYPVSIGYSGSYSEKVATDEGDLSLNFASPRIGSNTSEFDNKRAFSRGAQLYLRGNMTRLQQLPFGTEGYIRFGGAIADSPLITNEQFSLGGADTVRGYYEAEQLGDNGYNWGLELRSPPLLSLAGMTEQTSNEYLIRIIAFLEGGEIFLHRPLPGQESRSTLQSTGLGLRTRISDHFNGTLDWARPLISTGTTRAGSDRILFRVWTEY